jgi:phage FluMu gp28-like protein
MDVGRTRNTSEVYLCGIGTEKRHPLRLAISLDGMQFDDQLQVLSAVMERLPVSLMQIDRNGIGRNLAENLEKKFGVRCQGVDFTNETKLNWATTTKMLVQQRRAVVPVERDLAYQIHSIKRLITPSRNIVFDVETSEKHHADRFWAWALALASASGPKRTVRIGWA